MITLPLYRINEQSQKIYEKKINYVFLPKPVHKSQEKGQFISFFLLISHAILKLSQKNLFCIFYYLYEFYKRSVLFYESI